MQNKFHTKHKKPTHRATPYSCASGVSISNFLKIFIFLLFMGINAICFSQKKFIEYNNFLGFRKAKKICNNDSTFCVTQYRNDNFCLLTITRQNESPSKFNCLSINDNKHPYVFIYKNVEKERAVFWRSTKRNLNDTALLIYDCSGLIYSCTFNKISDEIENKNSIKTNKLKIKNIFLNEKNELIAEVLLKRKKKYFFNIVYE